MPEPHSSEDLPVTVASGDVVLSHEVNEETLRILLSSVMRLWGVVDDLTRLRPERRAAFSVSIFGSARIQPGTPSYEEVKRLAAGLTSMGCSVVTGGGPGFMQAANEGAVEGAPDHPERSVGIRIALEFEQEVNPYVGESFEHGTFFSRLHHFVLRSSAFIVTPGGIGTVLELMTVWQLLQVRMLTGTPLILVGDMWRDLIDWTSRHMVDKQGVDLVTPSDLEIPRCVDTIEEAIELVRPHYEAWENSHQP